MKEALHIFWFAMLVLIVALGIQVGAEEAAPLPSLGTVAAAAGKGTAAEEESESEDRIYSLKRCAGSGCPYAASWLAHTNLYRRVKWYTESTKMEAASFNIFDTAKFKFQLSDPDAYFVHHMSMYEHLNHKQHGFEVAKNKTLRLSTAAYHGECDNLKVSKHKDILAVIPFYGGLPPNVTADLSVKSIGQGNSLVDASTKALYSMATICSVLKYYGQIIIGVARTEDRVIINTMIDRLSPTARHRINIVQFQLARPAHLPFNLLAWGQQYVKRYNCHQFMPKDENGQAMKGPVPQQTYTAKGGPLLADEYGKSLIDTSKLPKDDVYDICWPSSVAVSHGPAFNIIYSKKNIDFMFDTPEQAAAARGGMHQAAAAGTGAGASTGTGELKPASVTRHVTGTTPETAVAPGAASVAASRRRLGTSTTAAAETTTAAASNANSKINGASSGNSHGQHHKEKKFYPIRYVYYTECDQVVRYDSNTTFTALTMASNESTFFVGRRKEKKRDSEPEDYMGDLNQWRECGAPGYSIDWPHSHHVQADA